MSKPKKDKLKKKKKNLEVAGNQVYKKQSTMGAAALLLPSL